MWIVIIDFLNGNRDDVNDEEAKKEAAELEQRK